MIRIPKLYCLYEPFAQAKAETPNSPQPHREQSSRSPAPPLPRSPAPRHVPPPPTHPRHSLALYSREAPPPAPAPAGPPLFLVELGDAPLFDHPIWIEHPNVLPSLRVEVRYVYDQNGRNTFAPAAGPADSVYAFMTMLTRIMDGFERARPGRTFRWFGIPAGFGAARTPEEFRTLPNAIPLLNHPADALKSGRRGPFFAEGLRLNAAWSAEFFEHLAAELSFRHKPDPAAFIITSENGLGDDYGGHLGNPDTGWVPEALADPRSTDPAHTIDGVRTFAQYMAQCAALDGQPIPRYRDRVLMGLPPGRAPINDENSEAYRGAIRLAWDWSRELGFSAYARAAFRRSPANPTATVRIGEYQAACDSPWAPVRPRPQTLQHQMNGLFAADLQCPEWYGGIPGVRREDHFNDDPGWETLDNWSTVFPSTERDAARRERRVALEIVKAMATAHARSAPGSPLAPYVSHEFGAPENDMVEYLRHCRSIGAWAVCVFMPKADRAAHDYWQRVVARVCA